MYALVGFANSTSCKLALVVDVVLTFIFIFINLFINLFLPIVFEFIIRIVDLD